MDSIATLQQLDQECTTWANQHAHSCNLLASLLNITRQREQTLAQFQKQQEEQHHQRKLSAGNSNYNAKSLLASNSLQLLIHKQTLEIESVINQLYDTINVFERVVKAMNKLEQQVEVALQRMDTSKILGSKCQRSILSSPSSAARMPQSPTVTAIPKVTNTPSLLDIAEISPLEVLDWVSRIRSMYAQELSLKQLQIHPGMTALDRFDSLADLQKQWGLQRRIDFGLEQDIIERMKAYRRVREYATRT
ncbi:hypothetical protein BG011_003578 [Mortierella polycephala]|uniref:Uncharacterized protein n=1 Tax=Mortierella polycephala TaxID=41804 RepID=A0A9P6U3U9_9FUNG|nr:hypothetical protein BG011_003578 [Mortierella polycephala]